MEDWATETSSVDDIIERDPNMELNSEVLKKSLGTKMTPIIDPNDAPEVQVVDWKLPPKDFYIIDDPEIGPVWAK